MSDKASSSGARLSVITTIGLLLIGLLIGLLLGIVASQHSGSKSSTRSTTATTNPNLHLIAGSSWKGPVLPVRDPACGSVSATWTFNKDMTFSETVPAGACPGSNIHGVYSFMGNLMTLHMDQSTFPVPVVFTGTDSFKFSMGANYAVFTRIQN